MSREMRGVLGRNQKRVPGSNQPEFKGSCLIDGRELWISGWVNENESGKYFSLSFKPKEQPQQQASPELKQKYAPNTDGNGRPAYSPRQQLDDEIPF
jgi:hypothetical protein